MLKASTVIPFNASFVNYTDANGQVQMRLNPKSLGELKILTNGRDLLLTFYFYLLT